MKIQRLLSSFTVVNPGLMNSAALVVRVRAIEIGDEKGRVRASIRVQPAETLKPTGEKYPETAILRLIDANGRRQLVKP